MAIPTVGTIPALPPYQPGALPIASTVNIEIVDTSNATAAASWRMSQIDFVGKAPSIMLSANPTANDLFAFFQKSTGLPVSSQIGNIGTIAGNMPAGGGTSQLLIKNSGAAYDAGWTNISALVVGSTSITVSGSTTVAISVTPGSIGSSQIGTAVIVAANIATATITNVQIATATITNLQIGTATITNSNIATATIIGANIATSTITNLQIAPLTILNTNIATNAIDNARIRQGSPLSVIGVTANATANVADIIASAGTQVLQTNAGGTGLVFGAITTGMLPAPFQVGAFTSNGVAVTNATGALTGTNFGTTGMFLMGNGSSAAPTFNLVNIGNSTSITGVLNILNGGTGTSILTPFGVMLGGTTVVGMTVAGATGQVFIGQSATSAPVWLAAGTSGFVLMSNGSTSNPQWVGSRVLINTLSPNQIASATDTTSFTSRYSNYEVEFENICPVSTALLTTSLNLQIATTGTAWLSTGYLSIAQTNVSAIVVTDATTTVFYLSGVRATTVIGTASTSGLNGFVRFFNPAGSVNSKSIVGQVDYITPGAVSTLTIAQTMISGFWNGASSPITGLAVAFQTGNIATGVIRIYGIA